MKSHYAESILIFTFLAPHVWTEHSYICGKKSSNLQCHKNEIVDINYVNFRLWRYGCSTAEGTSCSNQTQLIKEKCKTRKNCYLSENDFISCNKQPRRVFVKYYCTKKRWLAPDLEYTQSVEVCGSLSAIRCDSQYEISKFTFLWYGVGTICEVEKKSDINSCIKNVLKLCFRHQSCGHITVHNVLCFYLPLYAHITYSCSREGTTEKNAKNDSYVIPTTEVSPMTYVFDITKPPNTDEIGWLLNVDRDFRLLVINKNGNQTYSLCANNWKNEYAKFVCRYLNISYNGIAGNISRNLNIPRMGYGVDCPFNISNPFECSLDYSNHSREICDSIGDATVECYNHTENYVSDKTGLTGIIVGGILGFVFALIIIVVFIFCRRKKNKKENKRAGDEKRENASAYSKPWNMNSQSATANYHRENDMHDTGEQERVSLIIPTPQEAATQLDGGQYFVLDPCATGFNRSTKNYSDKDNENVYATSSDGVYDVTNERRHIEKDEINIYSHTVDDVYDTSAHDRKGKERDNAYDDCVIQNDG